MLVDEWVCGHVILLQINGFTLIHLDFFFYKIYTDNIPFVLYVPGQSIATATTTGWSSIL